MKKLKIVTAVLMVGIFLAGCSGNRKIYIKKDEASGIIEAALKEKYGEAFQVIHAKYTPAAQWPGENRYIAEVREQSAAGYTFSAGIRNYYPAKDPSDLALKDNYAGKYMQPSIEKKVDAILSLQKNLTLKEETFRFDHTDQTYQDSSQYDAYMKEGLATCSLSLSSDDDLTEDQLVEALVGFSEELEKANIQFDISFENAEYSCDFSYYFVGKTITEEKIRACLKERS